MAINQSISVTLESQDVINGTSNIHIFWQSTQTAGSHNVTPNQLAYYYITINGGERTPYEVLGYTLNNYKTVTVLDTIVTVPHGANGDCHVLVETWMATGTSAGTIELSQEIDLPKIARASTISATDANIGSTSIILVNQRNSGYSHSIEVDFGEIDGGIHGYLSEDGQTISDSEVKFSATNIAFTLPESFYYQIPNAPSGVCTLICRTYYGSTQVGQENKTTFTATASPALCSPVINASIIDVKSSTIALTGNKKVLIRYHSNAQYGFDLDLKYGATYVSGTINGVKISGNTMILTNVETGSGEFVVTDSRGYTTRHIEELSLVPYVLLTNFPSTKRTNLDEGSVDLHIEGAYYNGSFGLQNNALRVQYRVGDGEYKELEPVITGNKYTVDASLKETFDYMDTYDIEVVVSDALMTETKTAVVKRGIPVFDWGEKDFAFHVPVSLDGQKMINVAMPEEGTDVATKAYVDANLDGDAIDKTAIIDMVYPVGSIYIAYNHTNPSTLFGGTWDRMQSAFLWASTSEDTIGETGGEAEHTLTIEEMPAHSHGVPNVKSTGSDVGEAYAESWGGGSSSRDLFTTSVGGGQAHNNMPPYIKVSVWRRTA